MGKGDEIEPQKASDDTLAGQKSAEGTDNTKPTSHTIKPDETLWKIWGEAYPEDNYKHINALYEANKNTLFPKNATEIHLPPLYQADQKIVIPPKQDLEKLTKAFNEHYERKGGNLYARTDEGTASEHKHDGTKNPKVEKATAKADKSEADSAKGTKSEAVHTKEKTAKSDAEAKAEAEKAAATQKAALEAKRQAILEEQQKECLQKAEKKLEGLKKVQALRKEDFQSTQKDAGWMDKTADFFKNKVDFIGGNDKEFGSEYISQRFKDKDALIPLMDKALAKKDLTQFGHLLGAYNGERMDYTDEYRKSQAAWRDTMATTAVATGTGVAGLAMMFVPGAQGVGVATLSRAGLMMAARHVATATVIGAIAKPTIMVSNAGDVHEVNVKNAVTGGAAAGVSQFGTELAPLMGMTRVAAGSISGDMNAIGQTLKTAFSQSVSESAQALARNVVPQALNLGAKTVEALATRGVYGGAAFGASYGTVMTPLQNYFKAVDKHRQYTGQEFVHDVTTGFSTGAQAGALFGPAAKLGGEGTIAAYQGAKPALNSMGQSMGEALQAAKPFVDSLGQKASDLLRKVTPAAGETSVKQTPAADITPKSGDTTPKSGDTTPKSSDTTPKSGDTTPKSGDTTPKSGDTTPKSGDTTPKSGDTTPKSGDTSRKIADTTTPPGDGISRPKDSIRTTTRDGVFKDEIPGVGRRTYLKDGHPTFEPASGLKRVAENSKEGVEVFEGLGNKVEFNTKDGNLHVSQDNGRAYNFAKNSLSHESKVVSGTIVKPGAEPDDATKALHMQRAEEIRQRSAAAEPDDATKALHMQRYTAIENAQPGLKYMGKIEQLKETADGGLEIKYKNGATATTIKDAPPGSVRVDNGEGHIVDLGPWGKRSLNTKTGQTSFDPAYGLKLSTTTKDGQQVYSQPMIKDETFTFNPKTGAITFERKELGTCHQLSKDGNYTPVIISTPNAEAAKEALKHAGEAKPENQAAKQVERHTIEAKPNDESTKPQVTAVDSHTKPEPAQHTDVHNNPAEVRAATPKQVEALSKTVHDLQEGIDKGAIPRDTVQTERLKDGTVRYHYVRLKVVFKGDEFTPPKYGSGRAFVRSVSPEGEITDSPEALSPLQKARMTEAKARWQNDIQSGKISKDSLQSNYDEKTGTARVSYSYKEQGQPTVRRIETYNNDGSVVDQKTSLNPKKPLDVTSTIDRDGSVSSHEFTMDKDTALENVKKTDAETLKRLKDKNQIPKYE